MLRSLSVIVLQFFFFSCVCQEMKINIKQDFKLCIHKTSETLTIDGKLDEAVWSSTELVTDFWQKVPFFAEGADPRTEVRLTYDDKYLYVAAKCFQTEDVIIQSLKRDEYWDNDGIAIILDPFNARINANLFGTSAVGVQWDALYSQTSGINSDWSNKWYVETDISDTYWSAEFAIPFKILRYKEGADEWGLNFVRNIMHCNEYHNWTAVPESFWPPNPAFAGTMVWDNPPTKKTKNFNLIPYVTAGVNTQVGEELSTDFDVGMDARVAVGSSLNLDLTVNPDFSQIEVDELVTNLTRFNIFLPEKRTFFLENGDLFADFGSGAVRPFFSRRIGLDEDRQAVPILYGARLTGNLSKDLRMGFMNVQSLKTDNALAQNQTALSMKKQFGTSFVQGMFLNRQAMADGELVDGDYGRNVSLESAYFSSDGQVSAWVGSHRSFKQGFEENQGIYNLGFNFKNPSWEIFTDFFMVQENYFADMGFLGRIDNYDAVRDTVIRVGSNSSYTSVDYVIRPEESNVSRHRLGVENLLVFNPDWSFNERYDRIRYFLTLKSGEEFGVRFNLSELELLYPFSFTGETALPAGRYTFNDLNFEFQSDQRKAFSFSLSGTTGGFYNGTRNNFAIDAQYRIQPWGRFSLGYQWNDLSFPDPYGNAKITALLSKVEIGFSKNLLWTTLFQYVEQSDFMGINSRLQWRFSPMSDLFLVYLDNYDIVSTMMESRAVRSNNRALVLKVNYWY